MRCAICDRVLSDTEIAIDPRYGTYDPCTTCLQIISEVFSDPLDEEEIDRLLEDEEENGLDVTFPLTNTS